MAATFQRASGELILPDVTETHWRNPDGGYPLMAWGDTPVNPRGMWKPQPSLRKVIEFISSQIAQLPWHAYERVEDNDRQRVNDSPAEQILRQPSRWVTGFQLMEQLLTDFMLWDRFAAVMHEGELVRLPPQLWTIKADALGRVTKIVLDIPGQAQRVDLTDAPLLIDWGWSDASAGGISPMFTLAELLGENREAIKWRRRQWDQAPKFGGLLRHPTSFKDTKKREAFAISWQDWIEGRKGTPILEDNMEYIQPPQIDPDKARDIEGRQLSDSEVAGAYHVPPELLGIRAGNFGSVQAFRSMLFGPTLGPRITRLEQAVNRIAEHLDPGRPSLYLEINREAALAGSPIEQSQVLQTSSGGPIMTRAEARARMNLRYIDGTDELITPLNVLVGGQASPSDSGSQNEAGADGPDQRFGGVEAEDVDAPASVAASTGPTAADIKSRLDALGVAVRSGIEPDSAAAAVGLSDLRFIPGARPVTIKVPEDEAEAPPATDLVDDEPVDESREEETDGP